MGETSPVIVFLVSFLLGSIPFGLIISKYFYHTDIRTHGSGNIGTTNAIRTMGKIGGYTVFLLDFSKGLLSGFLANILYYVFVGDGGSVSLATLLGLSFIGCVSGHIFSPWLKFKGGKGIAVAIGCLFFTFGIPGAFLELLIFGVGVLITKHVSAGSLAASIACFPISFYCYFLASFEPFAFFCCSIAACLALWAHRENIVRLIQGTERRIGT